MPPRIQPPTETTRGAQRGGAVGNCSSTEESKNIIIKAPRRRADSGRRGNMHRMQPDTTERNCGIFGASWAGAVH